MIQIVEEDLIVFWRRMIPSTILVYFAMSSQIGYHGKMTSTAFDFTSKWFLACVAVHVSLERAWARKPLVANFALVFLLGAGGNLGAELAHHRLWWRRVANEIRGPRKRS